eukprot:scaffold3474_cov111-Isochrysis_galbana.AAC.7
MRCRSSRRGYAGVRPGTPREPRRISISTTTTQKRLGTWACCLAAGGALAGGLGPGCWLLAVGWVATVRRATAQWCPDAYADIRASELKNDRETRRKKTQAQTRRRRTQTQTQWTMSSQWVPCLKNAVIENAVNDRKTCKRDLQGTRTRIKDQGSRAH